jgi:hypothetical protein
MIVGSRQITFLEIIDLQSGKLDKMLFFVTSRFAVLS